MTQEQTRLAVQEIVARCRVETLKEILLKLYNRQLIRERVEGRASFADGKGFNRLDAPLLMRISVGIKDREELGPVQEEIVRQKLAKYWQQIAAEIDVVKEWTFIDGPQAELFQ